jgi:hypothetical protein
MIGDMNGEHGTAKQKMLAQHNTINWIEVSPIYMY